VSNIWETRSRLFLEELEKLVEWLSGDAPKVPATLEEQTVRLLTMAVVLLRQHQVNKRGQCQHCGWTRWQWRFWRRRRRCTVHQALDFSVGQSLDVVWWRLLEAVGRQWSLAEVRAWIAGRTVDASTTVSAEIAQDNDKDEPAIVMETLPIETTLTGGGSGGGVGSVGRCRRSGS
jgi:hypothetical protein